MRNSFINVTGLNQFKQQGLSPHGTKRLNTDRNNRWAMSWGGNRVAARNNDLAMPAWTKLGR
jgi:hypothetical protein